MEQALRKIIEDTTTTAVENATTANTNPFTATPPFTENNIATASTSATTTAAAAITTKPWATCVPIFSRNKLSTTWVTIDQCVALIKTAIENDYDHEYCINPTNLPYSRLYFDIDCLECKRDKRDDGKPCAAGRAPSAAASCPEVFANLQTELARCLSVNETVVASTMQRHVMVCESRPFCGFHVVFDVLIDFVARDLLMARLAGIKLTDRHVIDWPKNLLLPYGRRYKHTLSWNAERSAQVLPIVAEMAEALCPVRVMRSTDEGHISVALDTIGHDLHLVLHDIIVKTVYVARDEVKYTHKPLLARLHAWTLAADTTFDSLQYDPPHFTTATTRVVHRKVIEWFTTEAVAQARSALAAQPERYHIQTALEPYEQRSEIVERRRQIEDPPPLSVSPDQQTPPPPFYPFVRAQLEFYEEAVRECTSIDHDKWITKISKDTIKLIQLCLRHTPPRVASSSSSRQRKRKPDNEGGGGGGRRKRRNNGLQQQNEAAAEEGLNRRNGGDDDAGPSTSSHSLHELALELLDNAVACAAYTSTVSMLMRYGQLSRVESCKFLIGRYPRDRAGAFVWTRLALSPELDVFLSKNFTGTDLVYLLLKTHLDEISTQNMFRRISSAFSDDEVDVNAVFARDIYILKTAGSVVSYFTGRKIAIDRDNKMRDFLTGVDEVEIVSMHIEIDGCYAYRTDCGIFSPVTGVFENNGPSLNELVYRQVGCAEPERMQHFRPELFRFALDCFLKVPSYIRSVESTVPVLALVCPLWPLYDSYPDFGRYQTWPIRNFSFADFQTLLVDLNCSMRYPWPEDLCGRVARIARTELGMVIVTCVAVLYTLSKYVAIDPLDVVQVLISLLGQEAHSYIGIPAWDMDDEHNLTIGCVPKTQATADGRSGGGLATVAEDDILDVDTLEVSFRRLILDRLAVAENKQSIKKQLKEMIDDETNGVPLARTLGFRSLHAQRSVDMTSFFRKIDTRLEHYGGGEDGGGEDSGGGNVDLHHYDYVRCAVLMASWFVRMGELHVLNDCPLFTYINAHRPKLYEQLVEFSTAIATVSEARDIQAQTDHFLAFLERTELKDPDAIKYPATFNLPELHELRSEDPTFAYLIGESEVLYATPTDSEKRSLASAVVHLLRSGDFHYDYFIEFCKIIANLEYLGNRLRLGYNLYGTSSSGKSFFTRLLESVFSSGSNGMLSSRTFHDTKPSDNDSNAILLGTNFLVHLNEDEELLVEVFKKYVDFNYLSTRDMKKNLSTKFAIRAKVFFMSNHYVQVNKPFDSGFHNKYYPIFFNFDFVKIHDSLDRLMEHRSALKLFTTKYIGGQILMQRYPAGEVGRLDADIMVLSRQLLTRFFLLDLTTPVSAKKTGRVEHLYLRYFRITNPIQFFHDSVEVRPTNRGLDENRVRQILLNWWEKHKCHFDRIKSFATIADNLMNHFERYRVGKKYNLEFIMNK